MPEVRPVFRRLAGLEVTQENDAAGCDDLQDDVAVDHTLDVMAAETLALWLG